MRFVGLAAWYKRISRANVHSVQFFVVVLPHRLLLHRNLDIVHVLSTQLSLCTTGAMRCKERPTCAEFTISDVNNDVRKERDREGK